MPNSTAEKVVDKIMALIGDEHCASNIGSCSKSPVEMMESEISAFKSIAEMLPKRFITHALHLQRRRNAFLPINRLPDEILAELFNIYLESYLVADRCSGYDYWKHRNVLLRVSFAWQQLIYHTPLLWTVYSVPVPPRVTERTLSKTGTLGLRIFVDDLPDDVKIYKTIEPHLHRCTRLATPFCYKALLRLVNKGLPLVEELQLHGDEDGHDMGSPPLKWTQPKGVNIFPKVKILKISILSLRWSIQPFSKLYTLDLCSVSDMSLSVLMGMLDASPLLSILRLKKLNATLTGRLNAMPNPSLRHLRVCDLHYIQSFVALAILRGLRSPDLHQLRCISWNRDVVAYEVLQDSSYIQEKAGDLILASDRFQVSVDGYNPSVITISSGSDKTCEIGGLDIEKFEWWLESLRKSKRLVPSQLALRALPPPAIITVADFGHSITQIVVSVMYLRESFPLICSKSASTGWVLPNLSSIVLEGGRKACMMMGVERRQMTESIELVATLLHQRYSSSAKLYALKSITFDSDHEHPSSDIFAWLSRLSASCNGCKIFGSDGTELSQISKSFNEATTGN